MPQLLIEDIARAMEQDPAQLTALESRKYCILIDWALALATFEEGSSFTPLLKVMDLDDETCRKLTEGIVKALKANEFKGLDKQAPKTDEMSEMYETLCLYLGYDRSLVDKIDTGFISDYEISIKTKGFIYTNSLAYQPRFNPSDQDVQKRDSALKEIYEKLKSSKVFTAKRETFFKENDEKQLAVNQLDLLSPNKQMLTQYAPQLGMFYLEIISSLKAIEQKQNLKLYEDDVRKLLIHVKSIINLVADTSGNRAAILSINHLIKDIMPKDKKAVLRPKIAEILSQFMVEHPVLRDFKTLSDTAENSPVDRVILIGAEDLADNEVMSSLEMILKNHSDEKIVVTFDVADIEKVNERNAKLNRTFTLQAIGHGSVGLEQNVNANVGPYRGSAAMVGSKLAQLVNKCPAINHVRITGCFSGLLRKDANLANLREKKHVNVTTNQEHRRTLTMVTDTALNNTNSPFQDGAVAVSCWNGIDKSNRQISMTVSPAIIEPDKEFGRMMWKPSANTPNGQEGIKEVRVTTTEGPKNKPKI